MLIFGLRCLYVNVCALVCVIVEWFRFFPGFILRGLVPFLKVNLHAGFGRVGDFVYRAHCGVVFVPCHRGNDMGLMVCARCS